MIGKENRSTLEIILDSLSDDDWKSISLIRDTKEAFKKSDTIKKIKSGSIKFAEWILEKGIETHSGYYVKENNRYTAEELYLAYRRGDFEDFEDGSDD